MNCIRKQLFNSHIVKILITILSFYDFMLLVMICNVISQSSMYPWVSSMKTFPNWSYTYSMIRAKDWNMHVAHPPASIFQIHFSSDLALRDFLLTRTQRVLFKKRSSPSNLLSNMLFSHSIYFHLFFSFSYTILISGGTGEKEKLIIKPPMNL